MKVINKGEHLNVYHIGTSNEIKLSELAEIIGKLFDTEINVVPGKLAEGGTLRRCPNISKLEKLGFSPDTSLKEGLNIAKKWYIKNKNLRI